MWYSLLADFTLFIHLGFILFVVAGGLLAFRWRAAMFVHLPAAAWGALIEFGGWPCPLTPLEQWLREQANEAGFRGDFIGHYLLPIIYPGSLTREIQIGLGIGVVAVNLIVYGWVWQRMRSRRRSS